jgi:uncharacterized protein YaaR (DUF327 family)
MDRVDPFASSILSTLGSGLKPGAKKTKAGNDTRESRSTLFSEILENAAPAEKELGPLRELPASEEALTELMDAVHSAGSDLQNRPLPDEILRYKRAVRNFINYVLKNGYELETIRGIKKKVVVNGQAEWKEKVYHQVKVIDRKLDELAAAILSGQTEKLTTAAKMDEITGLLVDLTVTGAIKER